MSLQEPADLLSSLRSREEDEDDGGPNSFRGALSMLVPLQCLDDTNAQDPNNTSWTDTALSPKLSDKGGSPMMTSPLMSSPLMVSPRALHEVATSVPSASSPLTISGITNDILGIRESPLPSLPPHQQTGPPTTRRSFRFPSGSSDDARFCPNASGLSDDVLPPPPPLESPSRLVPVPNSLLASDRLVSNSNTNGATSTASAPNSVSARTFEKHMERDPQDLPTQDEILRFSLKRMDTRIASARGAGRALDIASPKAPTASEADNLNELPGGEVRTRPGVLPSEANAFPMGPGGTNGAASASRPIPPVPDLTKAAINAMLLKRQTQMLEKLTAKKKEEKQKAARKKEEKEQQWRRAREVVLARAAAAVASGDELEAPPGSFPDQGQAQTAARPAPPPVSSKGSLGVPAILRRRSVPVPAGSGAAAALRLSVGRTGVGALPPVLDSQGGSSEETHDKERGRGRERERVGGNRTRAASVEGTRQQSPSSVNPNQTQTGRPRWVRRAVASPVDSRRPKGSPPQGGGASSPGQGGQVTESSREGEGGKSAAGVDTSPPSSARAGELLSAVIGAQLSCAGELAASSETATQLLSAAIHREKREAVERQKGQSAAAAAAAAAASGKGGKDEDGGVSVERGEGELTAGEGEGERVSREGADGGAQQSAKGMKETSGASRLQRFMQRVAENSKRTMKPVYFDHTSLAETQIVNHFQRNTQITTKSGLMHNLRSLLWSVPSLRG
uniref:Uncharacterized protein n=1 Tax=Chromera velia CCMP2878 TaxID=1169474 RepID=A0A0K6S9W4_9ALVE|eukprot:Cvel_8099.t2-p1 / transcript=Cvel_8099.t2 / gene=Cvel_8099 / organism=Chromera_velia_CCMP2878 / gene_product=Tubulin glycylase 3C, putative / transcript_product=Tubulin glycylase 3C, putative / location=Cvel_scaffold440:43952-49204(+) / protein_length=734 / sequence_SO=supercontig / SO=protein_coding / is_pseudo=false